MSEAKIISKILIQYSLVLYYIGGNVSSKDFGTFVEQIKLSEKNLGNQFSTISIVKDSNLLLNIAELKEFVSHYDKEIDDPEGKKIAAITSTPQQTGLAIMFEKLKERSSAIPIKTFSTIEATLSWLDKPNSEKPIIEKIINEFIEEQRKQHA